MTALRYSLPADTLQALQQETIMTTPSATDARKMLLILFAVNLLNFFDRTIPGALNEPIKKEFDLSDLQLGLVSTVFILIYAVAGIPLGRLADTYSRKNVLAGGVLVWSAFTAASGAVWNYTTLLLARCGVGIGEASCAPAATSMIGDL